MIGNIDILVKELCKLPKEVGWVEFKHNNCQPMMVGEDISALANSATLNDRDYAYMILRDGIKGSCFERRIKPLDPDTAKRYMKYIPIWA